MRTLVRFVVAALIAASFILPEAALPRLALAAGPNFAPDWATTTPPGHWYTETNGVSVPALVGYGVFDDPTIKMWSEYQRLGGVGVLGYPVSGPFLLDGYVVQAFQKAVLQWHPEMGHATFVNIFDRLHDAGKDAYLQSLDQIPPPLDTGPDTGLSWPQVVARHDALLNANPAIRAAYFADSDPLDHYGLPMTGPVDEGSMIVVRCQRAVFQQWKVAEPWAAAGQVVVANGGDIFKAAGLVPYFALGAFTPSVANVSAEPIHKDASTVTLTAVDLPPYYLPVIPFLPRPTQSGTTVPKATPSAPAAQPPNAPSPGSSNGGLDETNLQALQQGLVNEAVVRFVNGNAKNGLPFVAQVADVFETPDGGHWSYEQRVSTSQAHGDQPVAIPSVGEESSAWSGQATFPDGTKANALNVIFRQGNVVVSTVVYDVNAPSADLAIRLARASVTRINYQG